MGSRGKDLFFNKNKQANKNKPKKPYACVLWVSPRDKICLQWCPWIKTMMSNAETSVQQELRCFILSANPVSECWFQFLLFCFPPSSLKMHLGRQQIMAHHLGPCTHAEDLDGVPVSWLQPHLTGTNQNKPEQTRTNQNKPEQTRDKDLSVCVAPSAFW